MLWGYQLILLHEQAFHYQLPEGAIYEGEYLNGKFHGKGTLTFTDGMTYRGNFKDGLYYGYGVLNWSGSEYRQLVRSLQKSESMMIPTYVGGVVFNDEIKIAFLILVKSW